MSFDLLGDVPAVIELYAKSDQGGLRRGLGPLSVRFEYLEDKKKLVNFTLKSAVDFVNGHGSISEENKNSKNDVMGVLRNADYLIRVFDNQYFPVRSPRDQSLIKDTRLTSINSNIFWDFVRNGKEPFYLCKMTLSLTSDLGLVSGLQGLVTDHYDAKATYR